ncbi:MAG TPA: YceI family protein [Flavitalea sp.]|nr:YceI family protein [Flavitalea sp.]
MFDVATSIYYIKMQHHVKRIITLIFVFISLASLGQTTWKSDKNHSKLTFMVTHLGISDVLGMFSDFDVTIVASKPDFSDSKFELTAQTASLTTSVEKRDNHLRSADFFNVEKNPALTFKSSSLTKSTGDNKYKLAGDLTINGITRPATLDLWYRGTINNPGSKAPTAGFQLTGTIKRSDYSFGPKFTPPMLSDEVAIRADGEFSPNN